MTAVFKLNHTHLNPVSCYSIHDSIFHLFGWQELPESIKNVIRPDLNAYQEEVNGNYSTNDPFVCQRRQSVRYWVEMYLGNMASEETVVKALSPSI